MFSRHMRGSARVLSNFALAWRNLLLQVLDGNSTILDASEDSDMLNVSDTTDARDEANTNLSNETFSQISIQLRSEGINYFQLLEAPRIKADLVVSVQRRFATLLDISIDLVSVTLAPGSLLIYVIIVVTGDVAQARGQITQKVGDGSLEQDLALDLNWVPGISTVSLGPIAVSVELVDSQIFQADSTNATVQSAKRSPLLASHLAFDLKLPGGTWLLCYQYGSQSGSVKVANLPVFGAGSLRSITGGTLQPKVTEPFGLEVYAPLGGLLLDDQLVIVDAQEFCGVPSAHVEGSFELAGTGSTGDPNTSLQFGNISINRAGLYMGCWCWSGQSDCSRHDFALDNFTVRGPVNFLPVSMAAGDSFELSVYGFGLTFLDAFRFVNGSCGGPAEELQRDLHGGDGTDRARTWQNLSFKEPGSYQLCWCSANCSAGGFDFSVGALQIWGPVPAVHRCTMSSSCAIALDGVPNSETTEILLRSGETVCEGSLAAPLTVNGLTNPQQSQAAVPGFYSRLRFSPIRSRSGQEVQIAELVFYFRGSRVRISGSSTRLAGGSGPSEEGPEKALDQLRATKFLDFNQVGFEVALPRPIQVDAVSYITANDEPKRDPTAFLLEGFADEWHVLAAPGQLTPPITRFQETEQIPCLVEDNVWGAESQFTRIPLYLPLYIRYI